MNLKSLLHKSANELKKAGIPTPDLDARVLLQGTVQKDSAFIYSHPEYSLSDAKLNKYKRFIQRRKTGEPIAYILKHKEFFGYDFFVNKNVLVPRPESEWLVEQGVEFISKFYVIPTEVEGSSNNKISPTPPLARGRNDKINILDVGTGSGCLIISLYKNLLATDCQLPATANFYGAEISSRAVVVAKKNAKNMGANNVKFYISDLFSNPKIKDKIFDLIVANLPYVPQKQARSSKLETRNFGEAISFEPQDAIFADDNGAAIIKKFLLEAKDHLSVSGMILIELDPRNAKSILKYSQEIYPQATIELSKDLAGLIRYLQINT